MRIFHEWALALALFCVLILDGVISIYLVPLTQLGSVRASSLLLPVGVILIALFDDTNRKEIYLALGAGLLADLYYLGIVGVYTVALPFLTFLCQKFSRYLPETFWARLLAVLIGIVILEVYIWLVFAGLGLSAVSFGQMVASLAYSLIWAILYTVITYALWEHLARSYPFLVDLDAYRQ